MYFYYYYSKRKEFHKWWWSKQSIKSAGSDVIAHTNEGPAASIALYVDVDGHDVVEPASTCMHSLKRAYVDAYY